MNSIRTSLRKLKSYTKVRLDFTQAQYANIAEHTRQDISICARGTSTIKPPEFMDAPTLVHQENFPDIRARVLQDVIVSPYSPLIVRGKHLLRPPHLKDTEGRITTTSSGLMKNVRGRTFATRRARHYVPAAINLGVAGVFNWYHFLLEFLPKLWLAQRLPMEFDDCVLLLPEECRRTPSFAAATNLFLNDRRVLHVSNGTCVRVDRLVTIDDVSIGPFNMILGKWPRLSDYAQHDGAVRDYARAMRDRLLEGAPPPPSGGDRIFLARPGERRNFNQDTLIEIAEGFGFTPVYLEKLTLPEQARVFSRATHVIGASGAAWSGMIFCSHTMKGLSWLPSAYSEFSTYSGLAHLLGHQMLFIEAEYDRILLSTGDAYKADYRVNPTAFENALKTLEKESEG